MKPTKFDEYLEFPCDFTFKAMGIAEDNLADQVIAVLQQHAPGDYSPTIKASSKGTYSSVSVKVVVTSKDHIETIYKALADIDAIRYVL